MTDVQISRTVPSVDCIPALDAELRASLADHMSGMSYSSGVVTVYLTVNAIPSDTATATTIVMAHDMAARTQAQTDKAQRLTDLQNMLNSHAQDWLTKLDNAQTQANSDDAILAGGPTNAQVVTCVRHVEARDIQVYQGLEILIKAIQIIKDLI